MVRDFREAPRETLRVFLQDTLLVGPAAPLLAQLEQHLPQALVRLTASAEDSCLGLVAEHCKAQGDTFPAVARALCDAGARRPPAALQKAFWGGRPCGPAADRVAALPAAPVLHPPAGEARHCAHGTRQRRARGTAAAPDGRRHRPGGGAAVACRPRAPCAGAAAGRGTGLRPAHGPGLRCLQRAHAGAAGVVAAGAAAPAPLPSAAQETCAPGAGAGTTGAAPPPQALP